MQRYIEELLAYQQVLYYVEDSIISLLMWRPQSEIRMFGKTVGCPTHSFIAFLCFASLVERPEYLPSFFFLSVAWVSLSLWLVFVACGFTPTLVCRILVLCQQIFFSLALSSSRVLKFLIAVMSFRRQAPNPWTRCKSYTELFNMLIRGKSTEPPDMIKPNENIEAAKAAIDEWQQRILESEERNKKAYEDSLKAQAEYEKDMAEIGEAKTDISTKAGGVSVDIFKPIFFPIQKNLAMACRTLRYMKAVATWDECYFTFWIATLSVILGVTFLFVPWMWMMKWSARCTVWGKSLVVVMTTFFIAHEKLKLPYCLTLVK